MNPVLTILILSFLLLKSRSNDVTSTHKKVNGLIPSPRNRKKGFGSLDQGSPSVDRKVNIYDLSLLQLFMLYDFLIMN